MANSIISETIADWETPYSDEVWDRLELLKSDIPVRVDSETREKLKVVSFGPALPDDTEPRIAQLIVLHLKDGAQSSGEQLQWILNVRLAPRGEPPEKVKEGAAKLGGREGLIRLLANNTPGGMAPVGNFRVKMQIEQSRYSCRVIPVTLERGMAPHDPAMALGRSVSLEQVGYRFDNGVSGLEEVAIVYAHPDQVFHVTARARGLLKLSSPTWLPYGEEVADLILSAFFVPGGQTE